MSKAQGRCGLLGQKLRILIIPLFLMFVIALLMSGNNSFAAKKDFDHSTTGFVLSGPHERLECNSCHLRGIFKGIPKQCVSCHDRGSQIGTTQKPLNHVRTSGDCESCHSGSTWDVTRFDHTNVMGTCRNCHNSVTATGKPPNHLNTNGSCDDCHISSAWVPARFDHSNITGSCFNCHNGVTATGKNPTHITSSNNCENCHSTNAWTPARFDHTNVTGTCSTCHDGSRATGKSSRHISTSCQCDSCHTTTSSWRVSRVNHSCVTGSCFSCHNNSIAEGKDPSHIVSTNNCDDCHSTNGWTPATFNHTGIDPAGPCIACHAGSYRSGPHVKTENPSKVEYTVSELQSCASTACHIYQNNTYTTIIESRPAGSEHSINSSSW